MTVSHAVETTRLTLSQFCSMSQSKSPKWVARLRAACPKGWSVKESRGSIRLSVRSGAGGANGVSKTLPIAWAADTVADATSLITRLHDSVESGVDLADALDREFGSVPVAKPSSATQWPLLLEKAMAKLLGGYHGLCGNRAALAWAMAPQTSTLQDD